MTGESGWEWNREGKATVQIPSSLSLTIHVTVNVKTTSQTTPLVVLWRTVPNGNPQKHLHCKTLPKLVQSGDLTGFAPEPGPGAFRGEPPGSSVREDASPFYIPPKPPQEPPSAPSSSCEVSPLPTLRARHPSAFRYTPPGHPVDSPEVRSQFDRLHRWSAPLPGASSAHPDHPPLYRHRQSLQTDGSQSPFDYPVRPVDIPLIERIRSR